MRVPTIPTSVIAGAIKAFPVGVGLPIMAIAASVGPDELASNLSKWYRLIGLGDPPTWLSDANFDRKALIVLFALATVYAFFAYIYPLLRKLIQWLFPARKRLITYSVPGSAVTICLIATFFAWKLWPGSQINMPPMPLAAASPTVSASPSIRKEKLASHFNKLILVCTYSLMPTSRNTKSLDLKTITKEVKTLLGAQDLGVSGTLSAEVYKAQIVPTASGPGRRSKSIGLTIKKYL
jgi:hypothetical protein